MKVIIAGSRTITDFDLLLKAIERANFDITEVVSGTAKGVDQLGERYANSKLLPCTKFPANWLNNGKSAGMRRNWAMAQYADALIALWDSRSRGTKGMIHAMGKVGKPTSVYIPESFR